MSETKESSLPEDERKFVWLLTMTCGALFPDMTFVDACDRADYAISRYESQFGKHQEAE